MQQLVGELDVLPETAGMVEFVTQLLEWERCWARPVPLGVRPIIVRRPHKRMWYMKTAMDWAARIHGFALQLASGPDRAHDVFSAAGHA